MESGLFAFAVTFLACGAVFCARRVLRVALDPAGSGPQKVHTNAVPRIGGIPILVGIAGGALLLDSSKDAFWLLTLLLAALPAFLSGLVEDFTKRYSAQSRLAACFVAAVIGFFLLDARITDLALPGSDIVLGLAFASFLLTIFAVGGFCHALNIIDGFNGLSGMVALLMLGALGIVAAGVGDMPIVYAVLVIGGAILGFLPWNFPRGVIFSGDGGAYLLGFMIAELAVLLVQRNTEVSPWFALLLLFYPVWETLFSSYRRKILRGQSPLRADALHLHTLVYRRLVRWMVGSRDVRHGLARNSLTTPYLLVFSALTIVPAMLLWNATLYLQLVTAVFVLLYVWIYWRIVRFHAPQWLVLRKARPAAETALPYLALEGAGEIQEAPEYRAPRVKRQTGS